MAFLTNLTDEELRATPVDVIVTESDLPTGAATDAKLDAIIENQTDGTQKAVVTQPIGTNLHAVIDSGVITQSRPSTSAVSKISSSATSVTLAASNADRLGLMIFNASTQDLFIKYGGASATDNYTVKISGGWYFEAPAPCYTGAVYGIWASENGYAMVTEAD